MYIILLWFESYVMEKPYLKGEGGGGGGIERPFYVMYGKTIRNENKISKWWKKLKYLNLVRHTYYFDVN